MAASESTTPGRRVESWASTPGTRASMKANRGRDTSPELMVRRRLHALGFRYRVSFRPISTVRRTADIVFTRAKVAVFIDGCFWHGCPEHYQAPARNAEFWMIKRLRNRERDNETNDRLAREGWLPLRFWEHEVARDVSSVAASIADAIASRPEQRPGGNAAARCRALPPARIPDRY